MSRGAHRPSRRGRRRHGRGHPRVAVYGGSFGPAQAERLLWRAGFGPRPGEAEHLARKGLHAAVRSLTRPGRQKLTGPAPRDDDGNPLAPVDAWGHDHLWWLDRMVRTNRPLIERMTLVWHDWFATSDDGVNSQRLMLHQNGLFRRRALGSFEDLLLDVTRDPAMLVWLSGIDNRKDAPNENYGRELMELFTLGAGRGYGEQDVREQARALTGFQAKWSEGAGLHNFRWDREYHDGGVKHVLGHRGRFDWRDSCRLCVRHRSHPSFFVTKLWSYFIPSPPGRRTQHALERLYVSSGYRVRPVAEAILLHPDLYRGPRMVKPPVVYVAGMLRALRRGVDTESWTWIGHLMGQQLFRPPNVAGWDHERWLDSATWRGRWIAAATAVRPHEVDGEGAYDENEDTATAVRSALEFWGDPVISPHTHRKLVAFADRCAGGADRQWKKKSYRVLRQNALRLLVATSPDFQTS